MVGQIGIGRNPRIGIILVEQIVNAAGQFDARQPFAGEQHQIADGVCAGRGIARIGALADVLQFPTGEQFVLPQGCAQIEFDHVRRRIGRLFQPGDPGLLVGVTDAAFEVAVMALQLGLQAVCLALPWLRNCLTSASTWLIKLLSLL